MPTLQEIYDHLGIDYADDMIARNIAIYTATAEAIIIENVGEKYPPDDPLVKQIALMYINHFYENRGIEAKLSGNELKLVQDLELKVKLKMRRLEA